MNLREIDISKLPRTAPKTKSALQKLGINTLSDLLHYYPYRYEDYSNAVNIADMLKMKVEDFLSDNGDEAENVAENEEDKLLFSKGKISLSGIITDFKNIYARSGITIQKATLQDGTGSLELSWFNQKFLYQSLKKGTHISVSGKIKPSNFGNQFVCEEYEIVGGDSKTRMHTGRIIPIYSVTRGISARTLREKIFKTLEQYKEEITEILPNDFLTTYKLELLENSIPNIHFPESIQAAQIARNRTAFDELLRVQIATQLIKKEWQKSKTSFPITVDQNNPYIQSFLTSLPFTLTGAQNRAIDDILNDMQLRFPMNRLLQGDVGCGKTVVAAAGACAAWQSGLKTVFVAPTEILAQQHFSSIKNLFHAAKINNKKFEVPKCVLVTSSNKPEADAFKNADILIGTHALFHMKNFPKNIGLIIIDEQHKFGVAQRAHFSNLKIQAHTLTMTATPIPRTTALALYGDLSMSVIDEMPVGRLKISTHIVPSEKREDSYNWIRQKIKEEKTQAFIICPLIETSEVESMQDIKAVTTEFEQLTKVIFPELKLGLLHGRIKSKEKDAIMEQFSKGEIDILVSTPVVEVGIDIPNATIMVIEGSERFGLAQLHQLRGRVGRSSVKSFCFLFTGKKDKEQLRRLKTFSKEHSGLRLAEFDLHQRGGGNVHGTAQHGHWNLQVATMSDSELIQKSHAAAENFVKTHDLDNFPDLKQDISKYLTNTIAQN